MGTCTSLRNCNDCQSCVACQSTCLSLQSYGTFSFENHKDGINKDDLFFTTAEWNNFIEDVFETWYSKRGWTVPNADSYRYNGNELRAGQTYENLVMKATMFNGLLEKIKNMAKDNIDDVNQYLPNSVIANSSIVKAEYFQSMVEAINKAKYVLPRPDSDVCCNSCQGCQGYCETYCESHCQTTCQLSCQGHVSTDGGGD